MTRKPNVGTFKLRDREFEVVSGYIESRVDEDGLKRWTIQVKTAVREFDGEEWAPSFTMEDVYTKELENLDSFRGKTLDLDGVESADENDTSAFSVYVFGHEDAYNIKIEFLSLEKGSAGIRLVGECNVYWDKNQFDTNVPFEINTGLTIEAK